MRQRIAFLVIAAAVATIGATTAIAHEAMHAAKGAHAAAAAPKTVTLRGEIVDTGCSLKAFRRESLQDMKLFNGMHRFLPTLAKMEGFTVTQVKVNHRPRRFGRTKYNIRNRVVRAFADLLAVRWMKKRHLTYEIKETIK